MSSLHISAATYADITAHARETFPSECCGFVVARSGREEVVRVTNMQDRLHAADPQTYPRTAATAYYMGNEQLPVIRALERGDLSIEAVYHSHPQHDAYFSEEDHRVAAPDGIPVYPQAVQIVISVYDGTVKVAKAFRWDEGAKRYGEVPLQVSG